MALEESGVPTVSVHTHVFARLTRSVALANGMPRTRQAFVPQPVVDRSSAELRTYIEGADPISGRPFMQEVLEGLSGTLDADDLQGVSFERIAMELTAAGIPQPACSMTRRPDKPSPRAGLPPLWHHSAVRRRAHPTDTTCGARCPGWSEVSETPGLTDKAIPPSCPKASSRWQITPRYGG